MAIVLQIKKHNIKRKTQGVEPTRQPLSMGVFLKDTVLSTLPTKLASIQLAFTQFVSKHDFYHPVKQLIINMMLSLMIIFVSTLDFHAFKD